MQSRMRPVMCLAAQQGHDQHATKNDKQSLYTLSLRPEQEIYFLHLSQSKKHTPAVDVGPGGPNGVQEQTESLSQSSSVNISCLLYTSPSPRDRG
eukprot:1987415-Rhodomonas_salina.3